MTKRELAIMNEAFMIGRIYATMGEKDSPAEIHGKLLSKCTSVAIEADRETQNTKERRKTVRAKRPVQQAKVKTCPHCGSHNVVMFTADDDICRKCGKWFQGT